MNTFSSRHTKHSTLSTGKASIKTPAPPIYAVALPAPLRKTFDYLATEYDQPAAPGCRVKVNFARQQLIGIVTEVKTTSELSLGKLKPIQALIDNQPLLNDELMQLCQWASGYYHHPIGEVMAAAIPVALRQGEKAQLKTEKAWQLTNQGLTSALETLHRAPAQRQLLQQLREAAGPEGAEVLHRDLLLQAVNRNALNALRDKQLVEEQEIIPRAKRANALLAETPLTLNQAQERALKAIEIEQFAGYLLFGTTGSGKTEVYLQAIERILEQGRQALILIPEIGLTPQTLSRFQRRFNRTLAVLHSGLSDSERKQAWLQAAIGEADIIIGTRSAIFTPLPRLGLIILDEEHDTSFKQQDGFRYSARDLAAVRAQKNNIPLILGSATPSLESLHNTTLQRYRLLSLPARAGEAIEPAVELVDLKKQPLKEGLTTTALERIDQHLNAGNQVLVFINRRGFAPTLMCHDCGWLAQCPHCDARFTVHQNPNHLHCHHCDTQRPLLHRCPTCNSHELQCVGQGTERSESLLQAQFPNTPIIRVDRDSTRRKNAMQDIVDKVNLGEPCILVGTQMLAKGHHFADVTLVVIVDADGGLFSTDFRGPERMGQMMLQVAGRAGRASKPGTVLIQSHLCEHPLLQTLMFQGYSAYARLLLQERQMAQLPPFTYMALFRAESTRAENAHELLQLVRKIAEQHMPASPELSYLGPLPAPMEKRNQRYRYQLQLSATYRPQLHQLLTHILPQLEQHSLSRRTRWSVDIDPQDVS